MNTFKSFALLENRVQVPVLYTENVKEPLSIMECYDEYYNSIMEAEIEFERAYCKGLVAMDEDTTVLNEGIIAGIIEFIQSIITGIIDFFSGLFGGGGSSSSGGSSTSSEVKTTKLYYEKFVKAKDKYVKTIQPNFNTDVTVDGKVLKTSYNTFNPENFINPKQGVAIEFKDETDQLLQFVDKIDAMVDKANLGSTPPKDEIEALETEINQASDVYSNYTNNASTRVEYMGSIKLKDYLDTMTEKLSSPEIKTFSEKDPSGDIPDNFKEIIDSLNGLLETCKKSDGRVSAEVTDTVKKALASVSSYTTKLISQYSTVIKARYKWVLTELSSYVKAVNSFSTSDTGIVSTNLIEEAAILSLYETNSLIKESQSLLNEDLITLYENPFDDVNDIINESQTVVLNEGLTSLGIKGIVILAFAVAGFVICMIKCIFGGGSSGGGDGGSYSSNKSYTDKAFDEEEDKIIKGLEKLEKEYDTGYIIEKIKKLKNGFKGKAKTFGNVFNNFFITASRYYEFRDHASKIFSVLQGSDIYNTEIETELFFQESDLNDIKYVFDFMKNTDLSGMINKFNNLSREGENILNSINSSAGNEEMLADCINRLKVLVDNYRSLVDEIPKFDSDIELESTVTRMKLGDYIGREIKLFDSDAVKMASDHNIYANFAKKCESLTFDKKIVELISHISKSNGRNELENTTINLARSMKTIIDAYSDYVSNILYRANIIMNAIDFEAGKFSKQLSMIYYSKENGELVYSTGHIGEDEDLYEDPYEDPYEDDDESYGESVLLNSSSLHSIKVEQLVAEAVIFSEQITDQERYDKLASLNEAIVRKIQEWWKAGIAKIKALFAKFMEKMNRVTDANYLKKYKDIILKQPFQNRSYKSKDLFGCMNRTLSLQVPYLDYNKHADILKGENPISTFFQRELAPKMQGYAFFKPNNTGAPNTIEQLANYCKDWFMGTQEVEFNGAAVQEHIKDVYDYLMDMKKIKQSIDKSINDIEKSAANVAKIGGTGQAAKQNAEYSATGNAANDAKTTGDNGTGGQNGTPAPAQGGQPQQQAVNASANFDFTNSVYSILYELEVQNPEQQNQQPASGTNANPSASGVRHVEDGTNVDQSAAKDSMLNDVEKVCKNYVDICTTVLKAKLTAIEFTRKELREIVRIHVQDYVGKQDIGKGGEEATNTQQYQNTIANNQV